MAGVCESSCQFAGTGGAGGGGGGGRRDSFPFFFSRPFSRFASEAFGGSIGADSVGFAFFGTTLWPITSTLPPSAIWAKLGDVLTGSLCTFTASNTVARPCEGSLEALCPIWRNSSICAVEINCRAVHPPDDALVGAHHHEPAPSLQDIYAIPVLHGRDDRRLERQILADVECDRTDVGLRDSWGPLRARPAPSEAQKKYKEETSQNGSQSREGSA